MARTSEPGARRSVREDGNAPTLPVAAVARRLGVAPATLRTWDRRYGLGPRTHTTGRHRRYGPADIARLEAMQSALLRGASSAEAARYALDVEPRPPEGATVGVEMWASHERLPGGARLAKGLCRAARAMDTLAIRQLLGKAIGECGVLGAWQDIIEPVLAALTDGTPGFDDGGARDVQRPCGPEVVQLLGECALAEVLRATPEVPTPRAARPVLLSQAAEQVCGLPLYVADAALCARGANTRLLGAALPTEALLAAVRQTGAAVVALWAVRPPQAKPEVFGALAALPRSPRMIACGPGWRSAALPGGVEPALGVHHLVNRIVDGGH